jgi:hypothetical protein
MLSMRKMRFAKILAVMLVITLAFGQGFSVMAMPAMAMDQASMMADMPGMDMTASASGEAQSQDMDCCSHTDKNHDMKGGMCGACCIAGVQAAVMPSYFSAPIRYVVNQFYVMTESSAASRNSPPDPPRPKA